MMHPIASARFHFYFFGYPQLLAETGVRAI